tara:strand:+ start:1013 stop:1609 length:597 start_codon:yes stop_codon:yes gene_type:complete
MNTNAGLAMMLVSLLLVSPVSAHEPKEYTILLKEDGITPNGVSPGILVSSDSLFFYNVDGRENATHRILVDVEGDGAFDGVDDIVTPWLSSGCERNETGQKLDPSCEITYLVLLDPSNGLLPSNVSMMHQIDFNGTTEERGFVVSFSEDSHSSDQMLPIGGVEELQSQPTDQTPLRFALIASIAGIFVLLPMVFPSKP